jgi:hypothetical protein
MNADIYSTMLQGLSSINMTERERARAEAGVRKSAAIIECLIGAATSISMRLRTTKAESTS